MDQATARSGAGNRFMKVGNDSCQ